MKIGEPNLYPEIFKNQERIILDTITIEYQKILEEINVLKINKQNISYAYLQIISKLVKEIIYNKVLNKHKILLCDVDVLNNNIEVEFENYQLNKKYIKTYKLNKFLQKYQKIYPEEYKKFTA